MKKCRNRRLVYEKNWKNEGITGKEKIYYSRNKRLAFLYKRTSFHFLFNNLQFKTNKLRVVGIVLVYLCLTLVFPNKNDYLQMLKYFYL